MDDLKEDVAPLDDLPSAAGPLDQGTEEPASSAEEPKESTTPPVAEAKATANPEEENVPFHKHPRFKRLIEQNRELKTKLDEFSQRLPQPKTDASEIPTWFSNVYGNDVAQWEQYKKYSEEQQEAYMEKMVERLEKRQAEAARQKEEQQERLQEWLDERLTELEDAGHEFNKEELLAIMQQYKPTDVNGNLDFKSGLELLNKLNAGQIKAAVKAEKVQARKGIAASTTTGDSATPQKPKVDINLIRKKSWSDLADED